MMNDLALFYSKYDDESIQAVVEFVLTVKEVEIKGNKQEESKDGAVARRNAAANAKQ